MLFGQYGGRQVANLTNDDVPLVARAIVACIRRLAGLNTVYYRNNVSMVNIKGAGFDVYIRGEDWLKIAPNLVYGSWNPDVTAVRLAPSDPRLDVATVDLQDADLYRIVSGTLSALFPTPFPTSNI